MGGEALGASAIPAEGDSGGHGGESLGLLLLIRACDRPGYGFGSDVVACAGDLGRDRSERIGMRFSIFDGAREVLGPVVLADSC